jgi:class 3 adenylate cyclase
LYVDGDTDTHQFRLAFEHLLKESLSPEESRELILTTSRQVAHLSAEGPRQHLPAGENCTVLLTDVVGFGAHHRNDHDRLIIRQASLGMMRSSLGLLWETSISGDRGDGLLIVVPPVIPTADVLGRLHRDLPGELRMHNRTYSEPVRIRLRVAVNVGPVKSDALGMSGQAIISAARLLDAPAIKEAMASTGASLGIIVSDFVYETAIKHAEGWADPDKYEAVQANVKESSIPAWMELIDPGSVNGI